MASGGALTPASLQTNQLRSLERQLEEENQLLTANFNQLKMAQQKFTDAAAVVGALTPDKKGAFVHRCCCGSTPKLAQPSHPPPPYSPPWQAARSWCP